MSAPALDLAGTAFGRESFDLYGPLPEGTTVLEASAGTGKTFTVAGLVTRYVAEGVATMDQLLVVSFSRESTRELRERVRERLVSARDGLLAIRAGQAPPERDALLRHLAAEDVDGRTDRLERALALFDAATVTTTHGFCQQVLQTLGTAGDHDPGAVLMEDIGDLVREVADDLYLRKWGIPGASAPELTRDAFHELALAVARDPATDLVPGPDDAGLPDEARTRARIAAAVRSEVDARKWRLHIIDYDDMLLRLQKLLLDDELGPAARERLRHRYRVVLVDEFQDTDPTQWDILRTAFAGHRTMVLIGDPKQSIYAFRGADVQSYLQAAATAGVTRTLGRSFRSDKLLMRGLDAVFRGASLGDARIRVLPVEATYGDRLVKVPGAPVRLRVLPRQDLPLTQSGLAQTKDARAAVAKDVAVQVVDRLAAGTPVVPREEGAPQRELEPGDIAVLVRTNEQARMVSEELARAGVPAVMTGRRSVFTTTAAAEWQLLLEALEQPHRITRVRRLALSCFVGTTAAELAGPADTTDELSLRLRGWARVFDERGVSALFEAVCLDRGVPARVLGTEGGERLLTDLRHVAQVLHEAADTGRPGLTALLTWLRRRRDEAARDGGLERSRRLESDAAAVQVITVHTSKGLEFPVTLVPFAWDLFVRSTPSTAVFHAEDGRRRRDVGGTTSPDWARHVARHVQEEVDDDLRLAYVAMTRVQSHLVVWWAPTFNTEKSPLHRLLLHDDPTSVAPASMRVPSDADALELFRARAAGSAGGLAVETVTLREPARWSPPVRPVPVLGVARLARELDQEWRRTSYSALTAAAHEEPRLGSEPEVSPRDDEGDPDEPATVVVAEGGDAALRDLPSIWESLPSGARFGTLVHGYLEDLTDPAEAAVRAVVRDSSSPAEDEEALTRGLVAALSTPLGPLADDRPLASLATSDRLSELSFELPLAGGDVPVAAHAVVTDLVPLWRRHVPSGVLAGYADALTGLEPAPLRGYLTGSIDAVLRVGGADPRYLVVDYKTNRLAPVEEPLTTWHYRPEAMERAMIEVHYPLQALLYQVALHRFLRWRQAGYDPERHLGGVLYLFLRGMAGPGVRCADGSVPGVFAWRPPVGLVLGASDLLAGEVRP